MAIPKFSPASPDAYLVKASDMSLAKFGHINAIVNELNTIVTELNTKADAITTANVTQTGSITTGVTVNAEAGVITTVSATIAGLSNSSFIVTNNKVLATSKVLVSVQYAGTTGIAYATISAIGANSFTVKLYNVHNTGALNASISIHFSVIN